MLHRQMPWTEEIAMTLDEELLQKARLLGTNWEDAERDAQRARADYNTAIRRLHLAGGVVARDCRRIKA